MATCGQAQGAAVSDLIPLQLQAVEWLKYALFLLLTNTVQLCRWLTLPANAFFADAVVQESVLRRRPVDLSSTTPNHYASVSNSFQLRKLSVRSYFLSVHRTSRKRRSSTIQPSCSLNCKPNQYSASCRVPLSISNPCTLLSPLPYR